MVGVAMSADGRRSVQSAAAIPSLRGRLGYLGLFFGSGLALSAAYAGTGFGLPCPFRMLTGWNCPLCGGTRMGAALLRGDPGAAFAFNPLAFVGLVVLTGFGVIWLIEALGGPRLRPPRWLRRPLRRLSGRHWLIAGGVLALGYTLARNLV